MHRKARIALDAMGGDHGPSVVVPGGFTKPTESATIGVPVGVEFFGRPWTEGILIEIGYAYEQGTVMRRVPPTTPALPGEK